VSSNTVLFGSLGDLKEALHPFAVRQRCNGALTHGSALSRSSFLHALGRLILECAKFSWKRHTKTHLHFLLYSRTEQSHENSGDRTPCLGGVVKMTFRLGSGFYTADMMLSFPALLRQQALSPRPVDRSCFRHDREGAIPKTGSNVDFEAWSCRKTRFLIRSLISLALSRPARHYGRAGQPRTHRGISYGIGRAFVIS